MAKTSTERMREKKERDEAARRTMADATYPYLKRTFSELADAHDGFTEFQLPLWTAGIEAPSFADERGPEAFVLEDATQGVDNPFGETQGAVGRAEVIVACLIDAAIELAEVVNSYKRHEIEARLAELESSSDTNRATAMKEAVRLNKMLDQLDKQVRRSFPQWKVTGV